MIDSLLRDTRHALRLLVRQPGFSLVVVVILALGIGANTAVLSVADAVLRRPLPYAGAERLFLMRISRGPVEGFPGITPGDLHDFRTQSTSIDGLAGLSQEYRVDLTQGETRESVLAASVTHDLFSLLGVEPPLGRGFSRAEGQPGATAAVLLSHEFWQRRFGGDPAIIGETIGINNGEMPVVGVLPPGFRLYLGPGTTVSPDVELWLSMALRPEDRSLFWLRAIGRRQTGVSEEQLQAEIDALGAEYVRLYPEVYEDPSFRFDAVPLLADLVGEARPAILVLSGAVALLFLVACVNAAGLLLARTARRSREIALRRALGAGRGRILAQTLVESLPLAALAALLGVGAAWALLEVLRAIAPPQLPRLDEIGIDPLAVGLAAAGALVAAAVLAAIPAWSAARQDAAAGLRQGGTTAVAVRHRLRNSLVIVQVALSLVLLLATGLLLRTFRHLERIDPGFDPSSVLTMKVPIEPQSFTTPQASWTFYRQLLTELTALPGVTAAGASMATPLFETNVMDGYGVDGAAVGPSADQADLRWVLPGYFEALGIRRVAGRLFTDADNEAERPVVVVDTLLARRAWPDGDPIGRRLEVIPTLGAERQWAEVVGVVEHARTQDVRFELRPQIYQPYRRWGGAAMTVLLKTDGDPRRLVPAVGATAERLGAGRAAHSAAPLSAAIKEATAGTRFALLLMGLLAAMTLILSLLGIYSLLAYLVTQRRAETGLRMALGASRAVILGGHLRQGLGLALAGVAGGWIAAAALTRFLESLLFGVTPHDPLTFVAVPVLYVLAVLAASYVPARRAADTHPAMALRDE